MAISHIAAIGSNGDKSAGTTLAVSATPGTQPAIGDLIVVACARDDIANDPLTGDSCSDGHGNTYTRLAFAGSGGTDASAGNSVNGILFYSVLTVAWSGTTTITWTHPSVTARGMQVEHFSPTSGYTVIFQESATNTNTGSSSLTAQLAIPSTTSGMTFGMIGVANDSTGSITGDSDTNGGSWSSITANAGTSGGTGNTNIFVATQYKTGLSTPTLQGYNCTGFTISVNVVAAVSFHEIPANGVAFVGAGAQVATTTSGATINPPVPVNATTDDLLLMVIGGRPTSNAADGVTIAGGSDGWTQHGSTSYLAVASADDVSVQLWYKIHDGSESAPGVTANTVLANSGLDRGFSAQLLAFRRVDTSTPFDVTPVNSNSAAAATWAPTGVSTSSAGAMAISAVATSDDNAVDFNTSQSFTMVLGGVDYDTTVGSDHAVAAACRIISAAGSVTQPTWNQSANGNDSWVGIATALKPGSAQVSGVASGDFLFASPAVGTRGVLGTAATSLTFTAPAVGTIGIPGEAVSNFTFDASAVGTVDHPANAESAFVFSASAVGSVEHLATAEAVFVFAGPATGYVEHLATAESVFVFAAAAVGTHVVLGAATLDIVFDAPAVGTVQRFGTAETVLIFTGPATGTRIVGGTATLDVVFLAEALGTSEHPATLTERTDERRPRHGTSARRPDSTTSERQPLATTSERRRSVPV